MYLSVCEIWCEFINPQLIEKDYWIMHALWGLNEIGFKYELKGGTSLSKGWKLIDRFSEDIDVLIHPPTELELSTGKNHAKPKHIGFSSVSGGMLSVKEP